MNYQDGRRFPNKLAIIDPEGQITLKHLKYGGASIEGFEPGDGILRSIETPFRKVAGIICTDTNFPPQVRQAGRMSVDIRFAPSLEVRPIDPFQAHLAAFRAIENGVTLVRQAVNGLSVVIDPDGRTVASVDHIQSGDRTMVAQVPAGAGFFTLHPLIGDLFAWLTVVGFLTIATIAVLQGRKQKRGAISLREPQALV